MIRVKNDGGKVLVELEEMDVIEMNRDGTWFSRLAYPIEAAIGLDDEDGREMKTDIVIEVKESDVNFEVKETQFGDYQIVRTTVDAVGVSGSKDYCEWVLKGLFDGRVTIKEEN